MLLNTKYNFGCCGNDTVVGIFITFNWTIVKMAINIEKTYFGFPKKPFEQFLKKTILV